jgi:hypothetical protein
MVYVVVQDLRPRLVNPSFNAAKIRQAEAALLVFAARAAQCRQTYMSSGGQEKRQRCPA